MLCKCRVVLMVAVALAFLPTHVCAKAELLGVDAHYVFREDGKYFKDEEMLGLAIIISVEREFNEKVKVRGHGLGSGRGGLYSVTEVRPSGVKRLHVVIEVRRVRYMVELVDNEKTPQGCPALIHPDFAFMATRVKGDKIEVYQGKMLADFEVIHKPWNIFGAMYEFKPYHTRWYRFKPSPGSA